MSVQIAGEPDVEDELRGIVHRLLKLQSRLVVQRSVTAYTPHVVPLVVSWLTSSHDHQRRNDEQQGHAHVLGRRRPLGRSRSVVDTLIEPGHNGRSAITTATVIDDDAMDRLSRQPLWQPRGFPPDAEGMFPADVAGRGWRLHEHLSTPIAVLDADALEHNLATMAAWCRERGVELQPHGKTTMAPQLFARQLEHGATAITAATPAQVRVMRSLGVGAVQFAGELVQPREAAWLAAELAAGDGFSFTSWVDSPATVEVLETAGAAHGVTFDVLLEVGVPGGRTGTRTSADRSAVVDAVLRSPHVRLIGVAGYEGTAGKDRSASSLDTVREYLRLLRTVADDVLAAGAIEPGRPIVLTAGGSMYFDAVAEELSAGWAPGAARVVLRSGCYVTHDSGLFHRNSPLDGPGVANPLRPALRVWGTVLSRPEPDRAFLDVGRRDVSYDQDLPVPLRRLPRGASSLDPAVGVTVTSLNDQHTFVSLDPAVELEVGDRLELGISHPCTTFDKWRYIPLVGSDGTVVDVITTCF